MVCLDVDRLHRSDSRKREIAAERVNARERSQSAEGPSEYHEAG